MKKIEEQIRWYEQNATRKNDDYIKANLKLINNLYEEIDNSEDRMFMDKIIGTFCEIIEVQRDVIADITIQSEQNALYFNSQQDFAKDYILTDGDLVNDKQLQDAFTVYMLNKGKSSYTVNDYCSRIRNLWKSFYAEYIEGGLPMELKVDEEKVKEDTPLLNVYNHAEEMNCYISMKIAATEKNRNWLNIRAAFNNFEEFKNSI